MKNVEQGTICKNCASVNKYKQEPRFNWVIFIFLFCFFIWPSLFYVVYCLFKEKNYVCADCGQDALSPLKSPIGLKIAQDFNLVKELGDLKKLEEIS